MVKRTITLGRLIIVGVVFALVLRFCLHEQSPQPSPGAAAPEAPLTKRAAPSQPSQDGPGARTGATDVRKDGEIITNSDPTSPRYDPVLVNRVTDMSPRELFDREPVNLQFATPREQALERRISERFRKRLKVAVNTRVTCRTSSCEVVLDGAPSVEDLNAALQALDMHVLTDAGMVGPLKTPGAKPAQGLSVIMLFSSDLRDHAAFEKILKKHRDQDELPRDRT